MSTGSRGDLLTDEIVERARADVENARPRPIVRQWHSEAVLDSIRHWVWGIGDDNPLWSEPDYGRRSVHKTTLAPPSFLYSCGQGPNHFRSEPSKGRGQPGLHAIWAWDEWFWRKPILCNTPISAEKIPYDVKFFEATDTRPRRMDVVTRVTFRDGEGEPVATCDTGLVYRERPGRVKSAAATGGADQGLLRQRWTPTEIESLVEDVYAEKRRGPTVLHWDDVEIGDPIPQVVKGPLTVTEIIAFIAGYGGPFIMASELIHRYIRDHPNANVPDPITGVPDFPERAHWDSDWARECGFPDAYDFGGQRISWVTHAVTNWVGDAGHLRHMKAKLRGVNILGDATWCAGRVIGKTKDDNAHPLVQLELWGKNQRGDVTITAEAEVQLAA